MFSQDTFKDANCDPLSDWGAIVGSAGSVFVLNMRIAY
jgi:hypothetical protein